MNNYKVGDRIKVTKVEPIDRERGLQVGDIGVVTEAGLTVGLYADFQKEGLTYYGVYYKQIKKVTPLGDSSSLKIVI